MAFLIAGNWKMHGLSDQLGEIRDIARYVKPTAGLNRVLLCIPSTLVSRGVAAAAGYVAIGGEDCDADVSGAFTGDISAEMLQDAGATSVIVGHSERRRKHHETNEMVAAKAAAARRGGLGAIICIGETEDQRAAGAALEVLDEQLAASLPADRQLWAGSAIAYEPLWAIGTGRVPIAEEIVEVHRYIRGRLIALLGNSEGKVRILYGGSVTGDNVGQILDLPEVGGVLVGGASLKASDFNAIIREADILARKVNAGVNNITKL